MKHLASIIAFIGALLSIWNAASLHSVFVGIPSLALLFLAGGFVFGTFFFPGRGRLVRFILGSLLVTAWIQILGSIFYYIGKLDLVAVSATLLSIPALAMLMQKRRGAKGGDGMAPPAASRAASEAERAWFEATTTTPSPPTFLIERPSMIELARQMSASPHLYQSLTHLNEKGGGETQPEVGARERGRGAVRILAGDSNVAREAAGGASRLPQAVLILASAAFVIFMVLALRMLSRAGTLESIRSPWEILPWQFFLLFFLAAAALIILALTKSRIAIVATLFFCFLFYSVTLFVYPSGYGFDPFIHQTTETYIAEHDTITPKPFFYVGQYALVTVLHKASALPVVLLDRALLPKILTIMLPVAGWLAFGSPLAIALLPLLPFSTFIATTPQGLANALSLIVILLALGSTSRRNTLALWILGIATLLTHPIAGVPLLIFLSLFTLMGRRMRKEPREYPRANFETPNFMRAGGTGARPRIAATPTRETEGARTAGRDPVTGPAAIQLRRRLPWHTLLIICITIFGSLALPLLFYLYGLATGRGSSLRPDALARVPQVLGELLGSVGGLETRFKPLLDFVYLYGLNLTPLLVIGAGITTFILLRRRNFRALAFPLAAFISFIHAVLLLAAIDFSFLPLYEQSGYAERLLDLARLYLFPLFLVGLVWGIEKILQKSALIVRAGTIALLAGLLTASLYLTYPHHDAYIIEHGWSVGRADIEAVRSVNNDAGLEPFIALANQAVSAAALREFGFKQYYQFTAPDGRTETVFYYPIPTGAPLYEYFLRMSYDSPRRTTIEDAMARAGVRLGYFVVNRYWSESEKIIERAKREADAWWPVENGGVYVFRFQKANSH